MPIVLDHMTVPVRDQEATLDFYTKVFGGKKGMARGRIVGFWLSEVLELQFRTTETFDSTHYAFRLEPDEFDSALGRLKSLGIAHGRSRDDQSGELVFHEDGQRAVFFSDPNDHSLELMTSR